MRPAIACARLRNVCTVGQRDRFTRARKVAFEVEHGVDGAVGEDALLGDDLERRGRANADGCGRYCRGTYGDHAGDARACDDVDEEPFRLWRIRAPDVLWRVGERGEGEPAENGRARLRQVGGVAHK